MNAQPLDIVTVIQTRTGSSRLPDKVLMPILGKPLFVRQVERVMASKLCGKVVVATTIDRHDDIIEEICQKEGIACFRGDAHDLLDRHYQVAKQYKANVVIKIPSDCPLIDPAVIDRVIGFYLDRYPACDYVSNLHPATYPDGNDVEVMSIGTLQEAWGNATEVFEREHTTPYIWERPERFNIANVLMETGEDHSMTHRWTIDYNEDYQFIKAVYEELYPVNPLFSLQDILALLNERPVIYNINSQLAGVNWYRHHLHELKTISPQQTKKLSKE